MLVRYEGLYVAKRCKSNVVREAYSITYRFISLSRESDFLPVLHALLHDYLKNLLLLHNLLTLALRASIFVINGLPSTLTFITRMLHLLDHRRAKVSD